MMDVRLYPESLERPTCSLIADISNMGTGTNRRKYHKSIGFLLYFPVLPTFSKNLEMILRLDK